MPVWLHLFMLPLVIESSFLFTYISAAAAFASHEGISCESIIFNEGVRICVAPQACCGQTVGLSLLGG